MHVILVYDISFTDNYSQRLNRIFKICKRYLTHIQKSVFEGSLKLSELRSLQTELENWIDKENNSVIVFIAEKGKPIRREFWGMDTSDALDNIF